MVRVRVRVRVTCASQSLEVGWQHDATDGSEWPHTLRWDVSYPQRRETIKRRVEAKHQIAKRTWL